MLVVHVDKVLERVDVAELDRPVLAKPLPIIQCVAIVAEDRRTIEQRRRLRQRHRHIPRHDLGGLLSDLIHIRGSEKAHSHVIEAKLG